MSDRPLTPDERELTLEVSRSILCLAGPLQSVDVRSELIRTTGRLRVLVATLDDLILDGLANGL